MGSRELIDSAGSIAITIGITGVTIVGALFLVMIGLMIVSCIVEILREW